MEYRPGGTSDLPLLARLNRELIRDERHSNPMSVLELERRMRDWLGGDYRAVLFEIEGDPVAYALYRPEEGGITLRQFFVLPEQRRKGIGRQAFRLLREKIWPEWIRVTVEVLVHNRAATEFWRALGFESYALTLESRGG